MTIERDQDLAEQALTMEKEFSHSLLESMADGVVACDADGVLTLFNQTARKWHGLDPLRLPPEEWAQHYDLFRADGITPLPTDEIPLARAFSGEIVRDAGMAIKAKGEPIRFIRANGNLIQDEAGQKLGAVVIMHDVTEFRRLESELRKANEELEQRVEERTEAVRLRERMLNESQRVGQVGGWAWDAVNDVIWWSDEYNRIYGFEPGTPPPNYLEHLQAYTPESAERLDAAVKRAMESGESYELDLELVTPTPATRWIVARCEVKRNENGAIVGLRGTAQNITERKLAEENLKMLNEQLAKSEKLFRSLFEQASDGIFFFDTSGTIISVNESFARLHGYTVEEMLSLGLDGLDVDGSASVPERLERIMAGEILAFEVQHYHKDGHIFPLEVTAYLVSVRNEHIIIAIHRNITERKRAKENLLRLNEELDQRVKERTKELELRNRELEQMNKAFVGRELKMVELKKQIRELEIELHGERQPPESDL